MASTKTNRKPKKRKSKPHQFIGRCVWCENIFFYLDQKTGIDQILKDHISAECKKHPMRKLERQIARLKKK